MKAKVLLIVLTFFSQFSYAQSDEDRAKAYYFEAVNSFESENYEKTLEYCQQVEDILGTSNARVEALRVKSYYGKGNMEKAKLALNHFSNYGADESLSAEIAPYIVRIEESERARIAKERAEEEARIKKQQEEAARRQQLIAKADFSEGLGAVANDYGRYGYIDENANLVIDYQYNDAGPFVNGLAIVRSQSDKVGMINKKGESVIDCKYEGLSLPNENGLIAFINENNGSQSGTYPYLYGVLDKKGVQFGTYISSSDEHDEAKIFYTTALFLLENDNDYIWRNDDNYIEDHELNNAKTLINNISESGEFYGKGHLELARFYFFGRANFEADHSLAFNHYSKTLDSEYLFEYFDYENIGDLYYNGNGTSVDFEKSLYYYEKMAESLPYHTKSLGKYVVNLIDVGQISKAEAEIQKIELQAKKEDKLSRKIRYNSVTFYSRAYIFDKQGNKKEAVKWYKKAYKNGHVDYDKVRSRLEELE